MSERRGKNETHNPIEVECDGTGFVLEPKPIEVGAGYTVSVSFDENEKPIISVKTYGHVDISKLRKEIAKVFPNAHICKLDQTNTLTVARPKKKPRNRRT